MYHTNIGDEVTLKQSQVCDPSCYYGVNNNVKVLHNELLKLNCGSSGHPRWLHDLFVDERSAF